MRFYGVLFALSLSGCGLQTPPPDTARLLPGQLDGWADPDIGSANIAQWAFAIAARTHGDPADAARAIAGVDYLAGAISTSPRWAYLDPYTKLQMLQARAQLRALLGIVPDAPSQIVVDSLARAADAIASGNTAAARTALTDPAFTRTPDQTLALLSDLPYVAVANIATQRAASQMQAGCSNCF